jgi:hypothetical protein
MQFVRLLVLISIGYCNSFIEGRSLRLLHIGFQILIRCFFPLSISIHSIPQEGRFRINEQLEVIHPKIVALKGNSTPLQFIHSQHEGMRGNMHIKLCLLEFETFLRVVISSANLTEYDWESIGQCIWYQDFPLCLDKSKAGTATTFGRDLNDVLTHLNFYPNMLQHYDFSAAQVQLVASISGYHQGDNLYKYGHLR